MKYKFIYKNTPFDFWQLSLYFMYGSIVGLCNVIFTLSMILLSIKIWDNVNPFVRILLLFACCLFPIIQPLGIYLRARKQAASSKEIEIGFDDAGIHVKSGNEVSTLKWKSIKRVSRKPNIIVIYSTTTHGFLLTNKTLGSKREEFYNYIISKINKK
jgi:hypothetical protein